MAKIQSNKTPAKKTEKPKPNMLGLLNQDDYILVYDKKQGKNHRVKLKDYNFPPAYKNKFVVSPVNYYQKEEREGVAGQPKRDTVKELSPFTFRNSPNVAMLKNLVTDNGVVRSAFNFSLPNFDSDLEAFNLLLACTEHDVKKGKGGENISLTYKPSALELVKKHFALNSDNEAIKVCNKLMLFDWGVTKCEVWNVLNFPNFKGKIDVPSHCLNVFEKSKKELETAVLLPQA